jgi:hypothetical protein
MDGIDGGQCAGDLCHGEEIGGKPEISLVKYAEERERQNLSRVQPPPPAVNPKIEPTLRL